MDPGRLNERITIIDPFATTLNEFQEKIKTPKELATVWASVQDHGGREFIESQKIMQQSQYIIKIRYRKDIYEDMEIKWRDKVLQVTNVFDIASRKEFLEIQCFQKGVQR